MSLTRRLQRLLRAHLGARSASPDAPPPDATTDAAGSSAEAPSRDARSSVPPEVAEAYRALEVPVGSDRDTVKKSYRRLMKKYHQDHFRDDEEKRAIAGTVSKRLNRAYTRINEYLDDSSS